jgi:hypothetical protein
MKLPHYQRGWHTADVRHFYGRTLPKPDTQVRPSIQPIRHLAAAPLCARHLQVRRLRGELSHGEAVWMPEYHGFGTAFTP